MALRFAINRLANPSLRQQHFINKPIVRQRSNLTPLAGFLDKPKSLLFHPENMLKHAEVIPIAIITFVGITCEILWTIRLAFTRDDVRFINKKAACEQVETRAGPLYPAPIRKFKVYNQKYETPRGLIEAIQGMTLEDSE